MAYFEGDLGGLNGGLGGGGFGDGWWGIILIALLFGWGRGGNGFGGYGGNGGSEMVGYELGKIATTNDVASGFSTSTILGVQRDQSLAIQSGFADVQQTLCQGFGGVNTALLQGFNGVQAQIADCCCTTQRSIDNLNYNMAKNTCDIIQANNCNTQRIIDFLTNEKISSLQAENSTLKGQISQSAQTSTLLNAINRTPSPAYVVPNPYCCYNSCGINNGSIL